jgi:predicted phage terminase large subunit-like protein
VNVRDLSGYLLDTQPDKYQHICIPARLSEDVSPVELVEKYTNGLFWEQRFSERVLEDFKQVLRPQAYASQLMMRPQILEGDLIKRGWFKYIKLSEVLKYKIDWRMVIDTAFTSQSAKNDPSAIMLCGTFGNSLYIRKVYQRWLEFYQLLEFIKETQKVYSIKKIYIESKASGLSIQQELKRQTMFSILPLTPLGDKTARVMSIQPIMESGRIYLIEDDWNNNFLNECASFPYGHDDQVDCLCYGVQEFLNKSGVIIWK